MLSDEKRQVRIKRYVINGVGYIPKPDLLTGSAMFPSIITNHFANTLPLLFPKFDHRTYNGNLRFRNLSPIHLLLLRLV